MMRTGMRPVMRTGMRTTMRTATTIEASAGRETLEFAVEAEQLGLDICWVAEAWGADAPSPLGYLAARTESMLLGSGVIQVGTRSPVTIAQTAMTLAHLTGGRFLLGLGVSGPQVIEGLHGTPFGHPLARMRETVAIVRSVFTGEKVSFAGSQYQIPRSGTRPPGQPRPRHRPRPGGRQFIIPNGRAARPGPLRARRVDRPLQHGYHISVEGGLTQPLQARPQRLLVDMDHDLQATGSARCRRRPRTVPRPASSTRPPPSGKGGTARPAA